MAQEFDFDRIIERRGTECVKYDLFDDPDVLPLWVADMDFESPPSVKQALHERVDHGIFGYTFDSKQLREAICERMARLYDWQVEPDEIVFMPGVVASLNAAMRATGSPGDNVLMQTPVYPPFLSSPAVNGMEARHNELVPAERGGHLYYEIDFDAFEDAIDERTSMFALCSPHNPVGRVWSEEELKRMAEICIKHDVVIASDEIHGDLIFDDHPQKPLAALSPEIAQHTITLMAPSKTFNIPSLGFSFAIIQNKQLKKQFEKAEALVVPHVGVLGLTAALGAYTGGDEWLHAVLDYMQSNRDYTTQFIEEHLPGVRTTHPEGTYLSWLDVRAYSNGASDEDDPMMQWIEPFFLKEARVALNNGAMFGDGGKGFARLNFAMPRARLEDALQRMKHAVEKVKS